MSLLMKYNSKHKYHQDIIRMIAIWLVMWNHTDAFHAYQTHSDNIVRYIYMVFSILCKSAVPLFFMMAGANLLGKQETIQHIYRKRISKFVYILILASLFYSTYYYFDRGRTFTLIDVLKNAYTGNVWVANWYLYAYICLLMMLPLFRPMVQNMKINDFWYALVVSVIATGVMPVVNYINIDNGFWLTGHMNLFLFTTWNSIFFIIGYFFDERLEKDFFNKKIGLLLILLSIVSVIISCIMIDYQSTLDMDYFDEEFLRAFIAIPTVTLYYWAKMIFDRKTFNNVCGIVLEELGGAVLGVYVLEQFLREKTEIIYESLSGRIGRLLASILWISAAWFIGVTVVVLIRQSRILRKLFLDKK